MFKMRRVKGKCTCGNGLVCVGSIESAPPCFYLSLADSSIGIDTAINLNIGALRRRYALRGVMYSGEDHFTSRILNPNGDMWYHDGIETGRLSEYEGNVHAEHPGFLKSCIRGDTERLAIGLLYSRLEG